MEGARASSVLRPSRNERNPARGGASHVFRRGSGRLMAANVADRQLLDPLCAWIEHGLVVGDRGYISQAKAEELGRRGIKLCTPIHKNMKKLATPFQVACLQARHRVEGAFEFLECGFGMIRSTHRAD